jgi:transposase
MQTITTIGLDIAKSVFQAHGIDAEGKVVLRRQLKRRYVVAFFQKLPPCLIGMEAPPLAQSAAAPSTPNMRLQTQRRAILTQKLILSRKDRKGQWRHPVVMAVVISFALHQAAATRIFG